MEERRDRRLIVEGPRIMGLDLMIGGAIPMLARHGDRPQTSILIRGDAGTGKTVLASYLAGEFAKQFDSDVAYACIELLPIELAAQVEGLYSKEASFRVVHQWETPPDTSRVTLWTGILDLGERINQDENRRRFLTELPLLLDAARARSGGRGVRVLVVDGVSTHYGLGALAPRTFADDLCKWAASHGLVVIVVEEATQTSSVWAFAVDMVLSLSNESVSGADRALRVTKSRFGHSPGATPAGLAFGEEGPEIQPPLSAYLDMRVLNPFGKIRLDPGIAWKSHRFAALGVTPLHQLARVLFTTNDRELQDALLGPGDVDLWLGEDVPTMVIQDRFSGPLTSAPAALSWTRRRLSESVQPVIRVELLSGEGKAPIAQALGTLCNLAGRALAIVCMSPDLPPFSQRALFTTRIGTDGKGAMVVVDDVRLRGPRRIARGEIVTPKESP